MVDRIGLLPLDNRPVSYLLPKQIADFSGFDLLLPERKYIGTLRQASDLVYLERWLRELTNVSCFVVALDNWVYGGLVPSRKHDLTLDALKGRVNLLLKTIHVLPIQHVYGFSSIMRIANSNNKEEERVYWKEYGKKIFNWSELMYKVGRGIKGGSTTPQELLETWYQATKEVPAEILADYISHRNKNFAINLLWLESLHNKSFEHLIFSCDDSGKLGMNLVEAEALSKEISKHNFSNLAEVISGTDEIPVVLLTKAKLDKNGEKPIISLFFSSEEGKDQVAKYESNTIYNSVLNQIKALALETMDLDDADIIVCVHCGNSAQVDYSSKFKSPDTIPNAKKLVNLLEKTNKPFILIDLAYANGADPNLINALLESKMNWNNCFGYAGWNTSSNSIGSALAIGINRWLAEQKKTLNEEAFKKCLLVRFLDDYAYQSQIRHPNVTEQEINTGIKTHVQTFGKVLDLSNLNVECSLPWKRSFEVEIEV